MIKWPKPKTTKNISRSLSKNNDSTLYLTLRSPHTQENKNTIELSSLSSNCKQHKKTIDCFMPNAHEKQKKIRNKSKNKIIKTKSQNKNKINASSSRTDKPENKEKKTENFKQNMEVDGEEREIRELFMNIVHKMYEIMADSEDSIKFIPEKVVYFLGGALQKIRQGLSFDEFSKECLKKYRKSSEFDLEEFLSITKAHFARLEKNKERRNKANLDEIIRISTPEKYEKKEVVVSSGIENDKFGYHNFRFKTGRPENRYLSEEPLDRYQENKKENEKGKKKSQLKVNDSSCFESHHEIQNENTLKLKNCEFAIPVLNQKSKKISHNNTQRKSNGNKISCMVRTVKSVSMTPFKRKQLSNHHERGSNVQFSKQTSHRKTEKRNDLECPQIFSCIESAPGFLKAKHSNCGEKPLIKIDEINKVVEKCINLSKMDTELFREKKSISMPRGELKDSSLIFQNINDKLTSIHQTLNDISPLKQMNRTYSFTKTNDLLPSRIFDKPLSRFSPNTTCRNPKTFLENLLPELQNTDKYSSSTFVFQNHKNDRIDRISDRFNEHIHKNSDIIEQWKSSRRIY